MIKILRWIKEHLGISILLTIVIIPIVIYFLSVLPLLPSGKNNDWAGFWGGYLGAIIGGICTVVGVYWTIQYTRENYEKDIRNRTLPYMALTALERAGRRNLLNLWREQDHESDVGNQIEDEEGYKEYRRDKIFIVINDGTIQYQKKLSKEQENLVKNSGIIKINNGNTKSIVDRGIISVPFELENVGNGAALLFRVGLNKKGEKDAKYLVPSNLKIGERIYVHIFSENNIKSDANLGDYLFEIYYEDIFHNEYRQKYDFGIRREEGKTNAIAVLDLGGRQEQI